MLKKIVQLKGVQKLNNKQLKNTAGGASSGGGGFWACSRVNSSGESHSFFGNQSSGSAQAWVNAWNGMGWAATCTFNPTHQA